MVRMTLRLNKELDDLLELAKRREKLSKNSLIIRACEEFINDMENITVKENPNETGI